MCPIKRYIVYFLVVLTGYNVGGKAGFVFCPNSIINAKDFKNSSCSLPPPVDHGSYITDAPPDTTEVSNHLLVYYACEAGYELLGEGHITCTSGNWSNDFPVCVHICKIENTNIVQWDDGGQCVLPNTASTETLDRWLPQRKGCGKVVISSNIIAGGTPVEVREMPWHAAVYVKNVRPYMQICGGTLVSTTVVISAAHCFWNGQLPSALGYAVAVGKKYRPWNSKHDAGAQKSDVAEIFVPPRYRGSATNFQDDIALLKLVSEVTFTSDVQPICLDFNTDEDVLLESYGKVAGWGLTGEDERPSPILKAVEMPYVPIHQCIEESPSTFLAHITSDKICAGFKNGTAVCRGDSGGGLVFASGDDGRFYLQGIVSAAPSNDHMCNVYTYAAFTLVSKHEKFITKHLS